MAQWSREELEEAWRRYQEAVVQVGKRRTREPAAGQHLHVCSISEPMGSAGILRRSACLAGLA